jgi:crotonobetainyl-CoA:carnitine CoA-transferase CaiB-like acyl-CoA transferase
VLDCSDGIAGPKAAMLLADFGADVVKVEPLGGDPGRAEPGFAVWNRNKRSITLDREAPDGRNRLLELLRTADVCVFSAPLDELERRGLDPDVLASLNSALVYVHLPRFTAAGPYRDLPESAQLLSAFSGIAMEQYAWSDVPVDPVMPHVLYAQSLWAAVATVAALVERQRSGRGQTLTISGMRAAMLLQTGTVTDIPGIPPPPRPRPGGDQGPIPYYRLYQCADGEWLIVAALTPAFSLQLFEILDALDLLADPRLHGEPGATTLPQNASWVIERLAAAFRTKPRDEWLRIFAEAGIPAGPARSREAWFDHEQVAALGMRVELDDAERGKVAMPGIALRLTATPGSVRHAAPLPGEHNAVVQAGTAVVKPSTASGPTGGPLAGVRVLDLGVVLAGPFGCTALADLGADVIKVEPVAGDPLRYYAPTFIGYNLGKRSIALDIAGPAGRDAFRRLVRTADVVIDNYRPGVLQRLGIDDEELRRERPDIITVSVTGYGGVGPLGDLAGFDPVLQCGGGMMLAQGGADGPVFLTLPVTDTPTALLAALGACLALYHRNRSGEGQHAATSLAAASVLMQSGEIVRYPGRPPAPSGGRDFLGPAALDRAYRTADGWVRLQAGREATVALLAAVGLPAPAEPETLDDESLTRTFERALATFATGEAVERLHAAGVTAVPVHRSFHEAVRHDPAGVGDLLLPFALGDGAEIWAAGRYAAFSRTLGSRRPAPPGLGEHTREILSEAGLSTDDVHDLLRRRVAVEGKPFSL